MARPPKKVRVGPHVYKITVGADDIARASHKAGEGLLGSTDRTGHRVVIDPKQSLSAIRETVLHECLHAVADLVHADLTPDGEEALVRRLAPALLDLFRRNPRLTAWLLEEDRG